MTTGLDAGVPLPYHSELMFLDLHTHSVSSDDSRATVEQYVKWAGVLRRKGRRIDGFVLTEHRKFDFDADYSALAQAGGLVILKGSEVDTKYGHFLVYGVTHELVSRIDLSDVATDAIELLEAAHDTGGIAVPAHPGRFGIGLCEFIDGGADFSAVRVVEQLNGSNRPGEQERAEELIKSHGYPGIGGSDAHLVSAIGTCMTRFDNHIANEADLVRELRAGNFRAVWLEDT
ncbi:MAG: PHP-associated domain-containing protein [SAR202 cluster bacterium]|nr:PHP-associated domain-containing protein [SAR202 cluster bacterium]